MDIRTVKLVYFSPTGTTKAVVEGIARGIGPGTPEYLDITTPEARKEPLVARINELLVIAVPVYMGRVPALVHGWLNAIRAQNTPAVCLVVYGNRTYEDALLELHDIVVKCGGIPIAGGAWIGEHSFSSPETPTAAGRPDTDDLRYAEEFGQKIRRKIQSAPSFHELSEVQVPGERPYRGDPTLWTVDFISVDARCTQCGVCRKECPTGAISPDDSSVIDQEKCITCCACIKKCPEHARTMKPGLVMEASKRLHTLYQDRKVPEYYL